MADHDPGRGLSPEGAARRDAMRDDLMSRVPAEAVRRRRRRRAVRATLSIAASAAALALLMPRTRTAPAPPPPTTDAPLAGAYEPDAPRITVERVATEPGALARATPQRHPGVRVEHLTDDELLRTLEDLGRPTGLVRTPGGAWVTSEVTDEQLANREG